MLFIPIGLEKNEVRRNPWVSYAIIAINVCVFLFLFFATLRSDVHARVEAKTRDVADYLFKNPYLQIPAELVPYCGPQVREMLEGARRDYSRVTAPPVQFVVRHQQQRLNTLVEEMMATLREMPVLRYGFVPAHPDPFALVTSMFVHAGWFHLIGNLLFFFAMGPFLEDVYGRVLFTSLYLLSGFAAIAAHAWQHPGSSAPLVGASGAIAGVVGAFLIRMGTSRIRFLCVPIILIPWFRFRVLIPAFLFLPLWFLTQFWLATHAPEMSGVAFWAHVGGFAFGALFAAAVSLTRLEKKFINPRIEGQISWTQNSSLEEAMVAGSGGNLRKAEALTRQVLAADPSNMDAWRYACELSADAREWEEFGRRATRLLEIYVQNGETDLARALIEEVRERAPDPAPAKFSLRAAGFLEKQGEVPSALRLYESVARQHPNDQAALRALMRIAEIRQAAKDLAGAREALTRALAHTGCVNEWQNTALRKLAEL